MNWLVAKNEYQGNEASVGLIENVPKAFRLYKGISLKDSFPPDAQFRMESDRPDSLELVDGVANIASTLLVSQKICGLLENEGIKNVEFLPVKILDHKGRETKDAYFIVNVMTVVDCIDVAHSIVTWNSIITEDIDDVTSLILDPEKLPSDVRIFRPKRLKSQVLVERALAESITNSGAKGFKFTEILDFRR